MARRDGGEWSGGGGAAEWTVFKVAPVFRGGAGMLRTAPEETK